MSFRNIEMNNESTCNSFSFVVILEMIANVSNIRQCTLRDVNCLRENRREYSLYRTKCLDTAVPHHICIFRPLSDIFSSLQPDSVMNETIGLNCTDCRPGCSEVRYDIQTTVAQRLSDYQLKSLHL